MKLRTIFTVGATLFLSLSCSQDDKTPGTGSGGFNLSLKADYEAIPVLKSSNAQSPDAPSPDDFAIQLTREDGTFSQQWSSITEIPAEATFEVGNYLIQAEYGDLENEGFDVPYYVGKTKFAIKSNETTPVEVLCTLGNVKISIHYTEAFTKYFTDYETTLQSSSGKSITLDKEERRDVYLCPGNISMSLKLTKQNGVTATYKPAQISNATARQHYIITMDVSESVGVSLVTVVFDNTTETEPITIDVSDEAMNAPAPYFTLEGITQGATVDVQECEYIENNTLSATITARGGVAGCTLTTQSTFLQSQGFPAVLELGEMTDEQRTVVERLGLEVRGFGGSAGKMGVVNFSNLVPNLQIASNGDADHRFTLTARDANGKVSETPVTFTLHSTPLTLSLAAIKKVTLGSTSALVPVQFNGKDASQLVVMAMSQSGSWAAVPSQVGAQEGDNVTLHATIDMGNTPRNVKVSYRGMRTTEQQVIGIEVPAFTLTAEDYEVWGNRVTMHVTAADASQQTLIEKYIKIYSESNGSYTEVNTTVSNRGYNLTGLTQGTAYTFKGSCLADMSDIATNKALTITTEAALELPNAQFENWTTWFSETINKGGRYGKVAGWQQETQALVSSQPDGWATVNTKTVPTSPKTKNTWYMVPSVLSTAGYSGNAALLRNVAWDNNGNTPPEGSWGSLTQSLESLDAPSIAQRSAGKMFLGSYSYDHTTGTEVYNEGISFTSRPTKLTGYYKYTAKGGDSNGTVTIIVEHRDASGNVITLAKRDLTLRAKSVYTKFEASLTYTNTRYKATHLRVMFAASNYASASQSEESAAIKTVDNKANAVSTGSELCIDNLTLEY